MDDPYEIAKETARRYRECRSYSDAGKIRHEKRDENGEQKSISMTFETQFNRPYDLHFKWLHDDENDAPTYGYSEIQFLSAIKAKGVNSKEATETRTKAFDEMGVDPDDKLVKAAVAVTKFFRDGWLKPTDTPEMMLRAAVSFTHGAAGIVLPLIFGADRNFANLGLNEIEKASSSKPYVFHERECYVINASCAKYPFVVKYFISKDDLLIRKAISFNALNTSTLPAEIRQILLKTGQILGKVSEETRIDFENVQMR